jgi:hypothetical protein
MNKIHEVEVKRVVGTTLELVVDGCTHRVDLVNESKKLANATQSELEDLVVSPSGYGIHWPQLDEDLAIVPMIGIQHEAPVWKVAEESPEYKTQRT